MRDFARVLDWLAIPAGILLSALLWVLWMMDWQRRGPIEGPVVVAPLVAGFGWLLVRRAANLEIPGFPGAGRLGALAALAATGAGLLLTVAPPGSTVYVVGAATLWGALPLAVIAADAGWLFSRRALGWPVQVTRVAALGAVVLLAICVWSTPLVQWPQAKSGRDELVLWLLLLGAVGGALHALVPILFLYDRRSREQQLAVSQDRALVTLQCPRCELWIKMNPGLVACPRCSLRIGVQFEEPRCGCGYPLHRLSGPACPECGQQVPPGRHWGMIRASALAATPPAPAAPDSPPVN